MSEKGWYDHGEGSEKMRQDIAKSAKDNPIPKLPCERCRQLQSRLTAAEEESATVVIDIKNQLIELQKDGITLETQNKIRDCVNSECGAPPDFIDGSGCESGDPVDLTLSEIMQGFNYYADTFLEPLEKKLTAADKQILNYEQTEAAVCPEDVGIKEYVRCLMGQLAAADKQIGWLKGDKVRLNKSIKVRDNAIDALMDIGEINDKQFQERHKDIFLLSVSEYCGKYNYQNCSCCEKVTCGDNTNPLVIEIERLREFARHVIRQECWAVLDLDGGDIQDLAEKLGLIVPCIVTEEDVDDESDFEVGDTIFKFSESLEGDQNNDPTSSNTDDTIFTKRGK